MDYKEIAVISCEIFSCVKIAAVFSLFSVELFTGGEQRYMGR